MYTASQKRKENIAEYLLYMWQIEDLIRANNLDIDKIKETLITPAGYDEKKSNEMTQWYESLIDMMIREDIRHSGHLQINRNVMADIVRLHRDLLADPAKTAYQAQFYKALPFIVELRAKAGEQRVGEIETCFNALYGLLLMRLSHKQVSPETVRALGEISKLIAMLAAEYKADEEQLNQKA